MENRVEWMLDELHDDGFTEATAEQVEAILNNTYEGDDEALVDYVSELNSEYPD